MPLPRVAFFTDTFDQINGVALTSRMFVEYARRHELPFLVIRQGDRTEVFEDGSVTHVQVARGMFSVTLDKGLLYDAGMMRHLGLVGRELRRFQPDLVHVVSPGDISTLGVWLAKKENALPMAISWHTNLHEFGARRLDRTLAWLPDSVRGAMVRRTEASILAACLRFYKLGDVLYAPNDELVDLLEASTGKPVYLMKRGIDTAMFRPEKRTVNDGILRLGYVGRITPEKSVRFLKKLEEGLLAAGVPPFRFLIVGDGREREWLRRELRSADLPGIRRGADLAEDYANMDVFVFPSRTDTFGNVVQEALASGVPAVVTDGGGPKFIVREGKSGFVASSEEHFVALTAQLLRDAELRSRMGAAAVKQAAGESWDMVFRRVYDGYMSILETT